MNTAPAFTPTHVELAERVIEWFLVNPDGELTFMEIARKFGVSRHEVVKATAIFCPRGDGPLKYEKSTTRHEYTVHNMSSPMPISDPFFSVTAQRRITVSLFAPDFVNPQLVLAAMLTAAATAIGNNP